MADRDYYLILGVPRTESAAGIRAAYRDLVKRHHPDVSGGEGAPRFREIVEAYNVLSDPDRRRRYNHHLRESERPESESILRRRAAAEPFAPPPPSIFDTPETVRPAFDDLFDRYLRNFTGVGVPKSESEEGLNIEVVLDPAEAARGGVLPITVPVFQHCPACGGTGVDWLYPCLECRAQGLIERRETVRVRIPPGVRTGSVLELPLRDLGIQNLYLRVHIRIGEY